MLNIGSNETAKNNENVMTAQKDMQTEFQIDITVKKTSNTSSVGNASLPIKSKN